MPTAAEVARNSAAETSGFISSTVNKVVGAATGLGSGIVSSLQYIMWGLIALAVIYVLATLVAPVVAAGKR